MKTSMIDYTTNNVACNNETAMFQPQTLQILQGQTASGTNNLPPHHQYLTNPHQAAAAASTYLTMDPTAMLLNQHGISLATTSSLIDWPTISMQAAAAAAVAASQNCCTFINKQQQQQHHHHHHQQHQQQTQNSSSNPQFLGKEKLFLSNMLPSSTHGLIKEDGISPPPGQKIDTSQHYHIFVGDLSPEIDAYKLRDVFSNFGFVTECKIIKDMHTHKPKGYGFVAYATYEEAELAKVKMNGQTLGSRPIRTNWAVRKPPSHNGRDQKPLNYEEVSSASSQTNSTIYIGAVPNGLEEDVLKEFFKAFGEIQEIRIFKEKGYAFVRFESHALATKAIITMHGMDLCGSPVKVSWGKETGDEKDIIQQLPNPSSTITTTPATTPSSALTSLSPGLAAAAAAVLANPVAYQHQFPMNPFQNATTTHNGSTTPACLGLLNQANASVNTFLNII